MSAHPPGGCTTACVLAPDARQALRALAQAVAADDLDTAIALGLLDYVTPCAVAGHVGRPDAAAQPMLCPDCLHHDRLVGVARDARLRALDARERHRAREARLRRRADARADARANRRASAIPPVPAATAMPETNTMDASDFATLPSAAPALPVTSSLPPAAAAALARAKARAAARGGRD